MHTLTKINLDDKERARLRRSPDKTGFVGIVYFANGPRGGRYRPVRTGASFVELDAQRKLEALRTRPWKQFPIKAELVLVDHLGNVLAAD